MEISGLSSIFAQSYCDRDITDVAAIAREALTAWCLLDNARGKQIL
jgi:hypothetical protein